MASRGEKPLWDRGLNLITGWKPVKVRNPGDHFIESVPDPKNLYDNDYPPIDLY